MNYRKNYRIGAFLVCWIVNQGMWGYDICASFTDCTFEEAQALERGFLWEYMKQSTDNKKAFLNKLTPEQSHSLGEKLFALVKEDCFNDKVLNPASSDISFIVCHACNKACNEGSPTCTRPLVHQTGISFNKELQAALHIKNYHSNARIMSWPFLMKIGMAVGIVGLGIALWRHYAHQNNNKSSTVSPKNSNEQELNLERKIA